MKNKGLPVIVSAIALAVVFNVAFFSLAGADKVMSEWTAYVFMHISLVALMVTPALIPKSDGIDSEAYPMFVISGVYVFLSLVAAIVFMCISEDVSGYAITIYAILTAAWFIATMIHVLAGKQKLVRDADVEKGTYVIDRVLGKIAVLKNENAKNFEVYEKICETYDKIIACPVKSGAATVDVENRILALAETLSSEDSKKLVSSLETLSALFMERNAQLR